MTIFIKLQQKSQPHPHQPLYRCLIAVFITEPVIHPEMVYFQVQHKIPTIIVHQRQRRHLLIIIIMTLLIDHPRMVTKIIIDQMETAIIIMTILINVLCVDLHIAVDLQIITTMTMNIPMIFMMKE